MQTLKQRLLSAFVKSAIATLFFVIVHLLYNIEIVRNHIEDIAFDLTNTLLIENSPQETRHGNVILFGFDDIYMRANALFDEDNNTNYGYMFPREKIVEFIFSLDEFCLNAAPENLPKALFIDYDFSFTSEPYGKILSQADKQLIDVLKRERPYRIILPKTGRHNFIEQFDDPLLQRLITKQKIIFASVDFLTASDGATRRYLAYKEYKQDDGNVLYPNVDIVLWQLLKYGSTEFASLDEQYMRNDIVANRFFLKQYAHETLEDGCKTSQSYWKRYTMYSAHCSFYNIIEEDFAGSVLMLGGTYSKNSDLFLAGGGEAAFKGVELHANTLMTLLYLDGRQLRQLGLGYSASLVFFLFFMVDMLIGYIMSARFFHNKRVNSVIVLIAYSVYRLQFIIVLLVITAVMVTVSYQLLRSQGIWFNWFIPVVLFPFFDGFARMKYKYEKYKLRNTDENSAS